MKTICQYFFVSMSIWAVAGSTLEASAIQLASADQLNPGDVTAQFPGASDSYLLSPLQVMTNQGAVTYSLSDASASFYRYNSNGQTNAFAAGTGLIDTNGAYGPFIKVSFSGGATEFGFNVQSEGSPDTATFTLTAFDGSRRLLTFTAGPIENSAGRGQSAFLGALAYGGDAFTRLELSSVSSDPAYSNFLILGPATFAVSAVSAPEPSSIGLFGLMFTGLLIRKGRRNGSEGRPR